MFRINTCTWIIETYISVGKIHFTRKKNRKRKKRSENVCTNKYRFFFLSYTLICWSVNWEKCPLVIHFCCILRNLHIIFYSTFPSHITYDNDTFRACTHNVAKSGRKWKMYRPVVVYMRSRHTSLSRSYHILFSLAWFKYTKEHTYTYTMSK